eukprot:3551139-Amphidinium_carterae.1
MDVFHSCDKAHPVTVLCPGTDMCFFAGTFLKDDKDDCPTNNYKFITYPKMAVLADIILDNPDRLEPCPA